MASNAGSQALSGPAESGHASKKVHDLYASGGQRDGTKPFRSCVCLLVSTQFPFQVSMT